MTDHTPSGLPQPQTVAEGDDYWQGQTIPLDYAQGHKDALEWAADLAEAEDPRTSDWLYDDPHALAAAIRKGPEMPPLSAPAVETLAVQEAPSDDRIKNILNLWSGTSTQHVIMLLRNAFASPLPVAPKAEPAKEVELFSTKDCPCPNGPADPLCCAKMRILATPQADIAQQDCPRCNGSGEQEHMTRHLGPDDYSVTGPCDECGGTGAQPVVAWRPEVVAFADAMEHKLRENDWKGGWKDDASGALMERVSEEMHEFKAAHLAYPRDTEAYRKNLRDEGADVANMVMMVLDVCGALASPPRAPVGADTLTEWAGWACQYPGKLPRLYGAREIAEVNLDEENGDRLLFLASITSESATEVKGEPQPVVADTRQQIIAEFLEQTGQYVTNDASREAAVKQAVTDTDLQYREALHCLSDVMRAATHALVGMAPSETEAKLRAVLHRSHVWFMAEVNSETYMGEPAQAEPTRREFTNELGNRIRITIEGPTSTSENILTPMEVEQLRAALANRAIPAERAAPTEPDRSAEAARLVYALCEDIEDRRSTDTDFDRGMRTAAKRIRKEVLAAMGTPAAAEPGKGEGRG